MKQKVPVSEIMSKDLITLSSEQSLYEVSKLFSRHNVRHIPVVENERLVGMVSHTDLLRISFSGLDESDDSIVPVIYEMYSVPEIMTRVPVFVESNTTIKEVAEILSRQSFHSLPVLDKGKLVGIVTTTDLINYLLAQY
ncbi:MAG TPA: CBS domain-containing protein [Flavobacteriaceae bacterium]|nr:CBS domain-containing protein [Flavobacteriaceae bacterium]